MGEALARSILLMLVWFVASPAILFFSTRYLWKQFKGRSLQILVTLLVALSVWIAISKGYKHSANNFTFYYFLYSFLVIWMLFSVATVWCINKFGHTYCQLRTRTNPTQSVRLLLSLVLASLGLYFLTTTFILPPVAHTVLCKMNSGLQINEPPQQWLQQKGLVTTEKIPEKLVFSRPANFPYYAEMKDTVNSKMDWVRSESGLQSSSIVLTKHSLVDKDNGEAVATYKDYYWGHLRLPLFGLINIGEEQCSNHPESYKLFTHIRKQLRTTEQQ